LEVEAESSATEALKLELQRLTTSKVAGQHTSHLAKVKCDDCFEDAFEIGK
jgi:hypothetical protein